MIECDNNNNPMEVSIATQIMDFVFHSHGHVFRDGARGSSRDMPGLGSDDSLHGRRLLDVEDVQILTDAYTNPTVEGI